LRSPSGDSGDLGLRGAGAAGEVPGSAGGAVPDTTGRPSRTADAGGTPCGHHRLWTAPQKGWGAPASIPAEAKGSPRLGRNGDDMMEGQKISLERQWILDRLETLSVKEQA